MTWDYNHLYRQLFILSLCILISANRRNRNTLKYLRIKGLHLIRYIEPHVTVNFNRSLLGAFEIDVVQL